MVRWKHQNSGSHHRKERLTLTISPIGLSLLNLPAKHAIRRASHFLVEVMTLFSKPNSLLIVKTVR